MASNDGTNPAITVRMPERLIQAIENLVEQGLYSNRQEMIRDAVRRFLETRDHERPEIPQT